MDENYEWDAADLPSQPDDAHHDGEQFFQLIETIDLSL